MKTIAILTIALALTGCASNDYAAYGQAQASVAQAKANADTARYQALSKIAETGSDSSRIAAVMALALGTPSTYQSTNIQAPQASQALQWAQVLVPSITNIASLHYTSRATMASADSAARVAESTNAAFVGISSNIQAPVVATPVLPQANVSTTTSNTTTTTSSANQANVTTTSSANQANTATTATTTSANPTTITLSGTGVVGSGTNSSTVPTTTTTTTTNPATQIPAVVCGVSSTGTVNCIP